MWSRRKPGEPRRSAGFMLVEVLVTAAVAAVLLAAVMRAYSSVWSGIGAVREDTEAMLVARAVIEASTPRLNLVPLTQEGKTGRYAWSIAITDTGIVTTGSQPAQPQQAQLVATDQPMQPEAQPEQQPSPNDQDGDGTREPPWTLFRIAVAVRAPGGRRTTVETFRLSRPAAR